MAASLVWMKPVALNKKKNARRSTAKKKIENNLNV
ncbi:hypothetical protein F441_14463 [Phytophthora nicotianae CJ01A1]|uniref:Uncharacterized protein n=4 Tax=Phytophthora nicotianae TaxID=4792 RepID=W2Y065_PHYNI|nr:hypothetical protein L915_08620 [Phytophthora nicotianae]ETO68579.1 hypothetical protein F444_14605 [Phytophthora nicotianae P1976]ETP09709.1 hypothetical protein F441_14463 [Phytophthora nicotianae CJ01A1]ETP27579.1 hypothetical protein F442_23145 [Phytophthora nicotianae P10297]ETL48881.1 hypothetical protein L916_01554 [Phytophthora nicotianae]